MGLSLTLFALRASGAHRPAKAAQPRSGSRVALTPRTVLFGLALHLYVAVMLRVPYRKMCPGCGVTCPPPLECGSYPWLSSFEIAMRSQVRSSSSATAISAFSASSAATTSAAGSGVGLSIAAVIAVYGATWSSPQALMSMPARRSNPPRYDRASSQAVGASAAEVR